MFNFLSKLFGGSKSEKDVKKIQPVIDEINRHFQSYQSLSHDELRAKTQAFRTRIQDYVSDIAAQIKAKKEAAGKATLIIAKQRNGPTGDVPLTFLEEYTRFEDAAVERSDQ